MVLSQFSQVLACLVVVGEQARLRPPSQGAWGEGRLVMPLSDVEEARALLLARERCEDPRGC